MNSEKLSIGQMANLNSVSTQTLRYYDKKGLLKPYITDEENGYRYYHINQCARLDMIQYLKSTGASLDEIKVILEGNMDDSALLKLLNEQLANIEKDILKATEKRNTLKKYIDNFQIYKEMYLEDSIFLEHLPKRSICSLKTHFNYFENGNTGYEMMMRELKSYFHKQKLPLCYFCNVGTIVRKEKIHKDKLFSNEVFVFVGEDFPNSTETIEENLYICICSEDFNKEKELAIKLLDYIDEHNYSVIGDYLCEVIVDFPDYKEKPRKLFYKIQIPIKKAWPYSYYNIYNECVNINNFMM